MRWSIGRGKAENTEHWVSAVLETTSGPEQFAEAEKRSGVNGNSVTFVLLFVPRTGSTMVKEWLGAHPAVRSLPAIFGKKAGWPKPDARGGGAFGWIRSNVKPEWDDLELRRSRPRKLIREIVAKSPDKSV